MNLRAIAKVCSKDKSRTSLHNVNLKRNTDGGVTIEATDGHVAVRVTYPVALQPVPFATLEPGQYTPSDWVDLVCKEQQATPVADAAAFPDFDQVMPLAPDAPERETDAGVKAIALDLELAARLSAIVGKEVGCKLTFRGKDNPIRVDFEAPGDGALAAAIMPWRLP